MGSVKLAWPDRRVTPVDGLPHQNADLKTLLTTGISISSQQRGQGPCKISVPLPTSDTAKLLAAADEYASSVTS
jgi:hypothetical protein